MFYIGSRKGCLRNLDDVEADDLGLVTIELKRDYAGRRHATGNQPDVRRGCDLREVDTLCGAATGLFFNAGLLI